MKNIKLFLLSGCLLLIMAFLSGCWNYREVENLAIVSGMAIDKKDDKYLVTTEIIEIPNNANSPITTKLLTSDGTSIFEAVQKTIGIAGKKLYFSHAKIVVISKELAEEGIVPLMDWLERDNEPRYTLHFLISRESSAKEILNQQPVTSNILSFELSDMLRAEKNLSYVMPVEEWQLIDDLACRGIAAVLPAIDIIEINGVLTSQITGSSIFKKDKLIGFLSGEETETLTFIKNKIKGGLLTKIEYNNDSPANISLEILKNKTIIKPKYINGKITIEITTNTDVTIGENGGEANFIDLPGRTLLKNDFETMLENNIKNLVMKVQEQYDSDIFGFGKAIKINMPDLWKQIEPEWYELFKNVNIEAHSTINIKNSALQVKTIKVGD